MLAGNQRMIEMSLLSWRGRSVFGLSVSDRISLRTRSGYWRTKRCATIPPHESPST